MFLQSLHELTLVQVSCTLLLPLAFSHQVETLHNYTARRHMSVVRPALTTALVLTRDPGEEHSTQPDNHGSEDLLHT